MKPIINTDAFLEELEMDTLLILRGKSEYMM